MKALPWTPELSVSIPNRDLDELQCGYSKDDPQVIKVSIPNRDLDELQWREPESQAIFSFQGAVTRVKGNHSIREFVWKECEESLNAKTQFL